MTATAGPASNKLRVRRARTQEEGPGAATNDRARFDSTRGHLRVLIISADKPRE